MTHGREVRDWRHWIVQHADPDSTAEAVRLREDLMPRAVEYAAEHGVLLIILQKLHTAGVKIPASMSPLARDYSVLQAVRRHHHERILSALAREAGNLPDFLVMKGIPLAARLYADPSQRPTGDVDVLTRPEDCLVWRSFLGDMGFRPNSSDREARLRQRITFLSESASSLESPVPIKLELHWELLNDGKSYIWPDALSLAWETREFVQVDGVRIPVLGLSYLLPYLCFHLLLHRHYRLMWLIDVMLLIRKHAREVFAEKALATIMSNPALCACVYHALRYAQTLFELPEAAEVTRELRPARSALCRFLPVLSPAEFVQQHAAFSSLKVAIFREIVKRCNR